MSPEEFAEVEELVIATLREYNEIWQSGDSAGEITRRLGTLAFKRILGRTGGPPNFKVWNAPFMEANSAFRNSIGAGRRFQLVG